jgi:transposase-like protein
VRQAPEVVGTERHNVSHDRIEFQIPKLRHGSYLSSLLKSRRCTEKTLLNVMQQPATKGVSTRRVDDLLKAHLSYPKLVAEMTDD